MIDWNKYPYTDFHELNLDWILSVVKSLDAEMDAFVNVNTIKYADPLLWNITSQYEQNTLVQDSDGNTYLSKKVVPVGIAVTNNDYWLKVADFSGTADIIRESIAYANDEASTTTSANRSSGDLVWLSGFLYKVVRNMNIGDAYISGGDNPNVKKTTIEDLINSLKNALSDEITNRTNSDNALGDRIDTEITNRTNSDNALSDRIDTETAERIESYNDLNDYITRVAAGSDISNKKIIIISDSYGVWGGSNSFPHLFASIVGLTNEQYSNDSVSGIGFNGDNGVLTALQNHDKFATVKSTVTDIIVVLGINDSVPALTDPDLLRTNIQNFRQYARTNYPNAKLSLGMIGGALSNSSVLDGRNNTARNAVTTIYKSSDGFSYLNGIELAIHTSPYNYDTDGLHPNSNGQRIIAQALANCYLTGSYAPWSINTNINVEPDVMTLYSNDLNYVITGNIMKISGNFQLTAPANRVNLSNTAFVTASISVDVARYVSTITMAHIVYNNGTVGECLPVSIVLLGNKLYIKLFSMSNSQWRTLGNVTQITIPEYLNIDIPLTDVN